LHSYLALYIDLPEGLVVGNIEVEGGIVKYVSRGAIYYVKEHFGPSLSCFKGEGSPDSRKTGRIPESFFSYGPIEKIVSLLGQGRANVVEVRLSHELDLSPEEERNLREAVGPHFYFSRSAYDYSPSSLPHSDFETAQGFQVVLDVLVRNWDDGERNIVMSGSVPVWFDFGASLDPACQNIYRFLLKLDEARNAGRVSSIITYFQDYSRRKSQILKRALRLFQSIPLWEIRTVTRISGTEIPGFFADYLAKNLASLADEIDILRGAFLRCPPARNEPALDQPVSKEPFMRQTK